MERGSEICLPQDRPPAMVIRSHPPAVRRVLGRGPAQSRNMAPIPCRDPAMALLDGGPGRKSPLGPCLPPPMGQACRPSSPMGQASNIVHSIGAELGNFGMILLLVETPSGFALFLFCGIYLWEPHAMENLWVNFTVDYKARKVALLKEFQTFDDKFSAINPLTGVSEKLKSMIIKWLRPGQKLAVGKLEYKIIIENTMGIPCLFGENVMEVMWGLKNLMHSLVPEERSKLTQEDRLPMSQGLKKVLDRFGFDDVKPGMVNEQIITTAFALFDCDSTEKKHAVPLFLLARLIKDVSGIYTDNWNSLKLATALKVIFCPEEVGDYHEMFSEDERSKLVDDAREYARKIGMRPALQAYEEIVSAYKVRNEKKILLRNLVMEAKERLRVAEEK